MAKKGFDSAIPIYHRTAFVLRAILDSVLAVNASLQSYLLPSRNLLMFTRRSLCFAEHTHATSTIVNFLTQHNTFPIRSGCHSGNKNHVIIPTYATCPHSWYRRGPPPAVRHQVIGPQVDTRPGFTLPPDYASPSYIIRSSHISKPKTPKPIPIAIVRMKATDNRSAHSAVAVATRSRRPSAVTVFSSEEVVGGVLVLW